MKTKFKNANEAYEYFFDKLVTDGIDFDNTKALFNIGFEIENPEDNHITCTDRKWKLSYANREWDWYKSGDPSAVEIAKYAPIWLRMMDEDGNVRSNYGWQWIRNNQLDKVVDILRNYPESRRAAISIYDGKEMDTYSNDTPCTYAIQFTIIDKKLNMSVLMRSNDIWYGFCNDQYCFSMLQKTVAELLNIKVGTYFHFAHNLHLYN